MTEGVRVGVLDGVGRDPDIVTYSNWYHSGIGCSKCNARGTLQEKQYFNV
jgi:hypothetical protein